MKTEPKTVSKRGQEVKDFILQDRVPDVQSGITVRIANKIVTKMGFGKAFKFFRGRGKGVMSKGVLEAILGIVPGQRRGGNFVTFLFIFRIVK